MEFSDTGYNRQMNSTEQRLQLAALVDMEYIERVGNNISGFWKII